MKHITLFGTRAPAVAVAAVVIVGAALLASPAHATLASAAPAPPVSAGCPVPVPLNEITPGMIGTGLTVSRGTAAEPFTVTVLGVLTNGIGSGVDLIVFEADSPALQAAGGIWAGMSGSPVYASDGRLIGAVSYGFSMAPSMIGGMTPAVAMMDLLTRPDQQAAAAPAAHVTLPAAMARSLVTSKRLAAAEASVGLAPLPIPLSVSGLSATRLARVNADLERSGSPMRAYAGSSAPGTAAPAGSLFAGSNFAAAVSYGDVTQGAIGTTTAVCGKRALAFGHPMLFSGQSTASAHQATAIVVVKDATMGSFKMANVGPVAGTVDQDRMVGLRAALGAGPAGTVPVTSTVRSGTRERTATTWVTVDSYLASTVGYHLVSSLDRVFDQIGPGRVEVSWVIRGTRADGTPWNLAHTNLYPSLYDASGEATTEVSNWLYTIVDNPFEKVKVTGVSMTATARPGYAMYTVDGAQVLRDGTWVEVTDSLSVTPGQPLDLRVRLAAYQAASQYVDVHLDVPATSAASGYLSIVGTYSSYPSPPQAPSFPGLLAGLAAMPSNNHLVTQLSMYGGGGTPAASGDLALGDAVTGARYIPVTVTG